MQCADAFIDDLFVRNVARPDRHVGLAVDRLPPPPPPPPPPPRGGGPRPQGPGGAAPPPPPAPRRMFTSVSTLSQIETALSRMRSRVSCRITAPPPVAITAGPLSSSR